MAIPDQHLRRDALASIGEKRTSANGAGLFWVLVDRPNWRLHRLLISYEMMADFLDTTNERGASAGMVNGCHLHRALIDALNPDGDVSNYYRYHPWCEDGDYLRTLVQVCQEGCSSLPSYAHVRSLATRAATHAQVLGVNHELDPELRDAALMDWAERNLPAEHSLSWFELTAAASAWLTIYALFAIAARPRCDPSEATGTYNAYFPWVSLTGTMLDSYVDRDEDITNGDHSYIGHYPNENLAARRLCELIGRATGEAWRLPNGPMHTVILASMIAVYLSEIRARRSQTRLATRDIAQAGGSLISILSPMLRLWRAVYIKDSSSVYPQQRPRWPPWGGGRRRCPGLHLLRCLR